jgi:uncharacterized protein
MTSQHPIDIPPKHRHLILTIARAALPAGAKLWVFGSRATGRARKYSDLDLAIDAGRRLTLDESARLGEAFSESDLPYRVDIVDWHAAEERFRRVIAAERLLLNRAADAEASGGGGNRL